MSKTSIDSSTPKKDKNKNLIPWKWLENGQPSPESKKAWRERRRQAQQMMDMILKYQHMTQQEMDEYVEQYWSQLTILEHQMNRYVKQGGKDDKMLVDMINRHVPYAPTKTEISWPDGDSIRISSQEKELMEEVLDNNL